MDDRSYDLRVRSEATYDLVGSNDLRTADLTIRDLERLRSDTTYDLVEHRSETTYEITHERLNS